MRQQVTRAEYERHVRRWREDYPPEDVTAFHAQRDLVARPQRRIGEAILRPDGQAEYWVISEDES
jgi:hypothetical protein